MLYLLHHISTTIHIIGYEHTYKMYILSADNPRIGTLLHISGAAYIYYRKYVTHKYVHATNHKVDYCDCRCLRSFRSKDTTNLNLAPSSLILM